MTPPGASRSSLFLWLDVVALDQHPCLNSQADISTVRSLAKACSEGAQGTAGLRGNSDRSLLCWLVL